jgi:hypothetical protein
LISGVETPCTLITGTAADPCFASDAALRGGASGIAAPFPAPPRRQQLSLGRAMSAGADSRAAPIGERRINPLGSFSRRIVQDRSNPRK